MAMTGFRSSIARMFSLQYYIFCLLVIFVIQSKAEILSPDRRITWNPGIPDGIPTVPTTTNVRDFGAVGDGINDDYNALQNAIAATASGNAILVPEGTYLISNTLNINKGIVLRGEGPDKSRILLASEAFIKIGGSNARNWVNVINGMEKGSTTITLANTLPGGINAGDYIEIEQNNDPVVMYTSNDWNVDWAENSVGQLFLVASVSGNTITVAEPLNCTFEANLNPKVSKITMYENAGLEKLYFTRLSTIADCDMIELEQAAFSWIYHCEGAYTYRRHVNLNKTYHCLVKFCYFHHSHDYGAGGHGYGVTCMAHATGNLVEDNILDTLRHQILLQLGATGNVYGYNYSVNPYHGWGDILFHGHMAFQNLLESNIGNDIQIGDWWGPCQRNTLFRNRVADDWPGIWIMDNSDDCNIVGNETPYGIIEEAGDDIDNTLMHGNYINGSIEWDASITDHDLPDSYYLSSKPDFFHAMQWPAIGADVASQQFQIPAQARFLNNTPFINPNQNLSPLQLSCKIYLQGLWNGSQMNQAENMPLCSPYTQDPEYPDRCLINLPSTVADWVLLQISDTPGGAALLTKSVLLRKDGWLVQDDGVNTCLQLPGLTNGDYYITIRHRNHCGALSSSWVSLQTDNCTVYDFTSGSDKYYGSNSAFIKNNLAMNWAGDGNQDQNIDIDDYSTWLLDAASALNGYLNRDYNSDGVINSKDYVLWYNNFKAGASSGLPD